MSSNDIRQFVPRALAEARKRRGMSVEEVAARAGVSAQAVLKHEDGKNLPQLEVFIAEMAALDLDFCSLHELLLSVKAQQAIAGISDRLAKVEARLKKLEA
jgi:DNA-binding XRE family transcriptional regulator